MASFQSLLLSLCLVFLGPHLPQISGGDAWTSNRCDLFKLYNQGTCRPGQCLNHEYSIPGNSHCDRLALTNGGYYTRCFDKPLCCDYGGKCRVKCQQSEVIQDRTADCPYQCCTQHQDNNCGSLHTLSTRIVGGAVGQPTDWPWMARIIYSTAVSGGICEGVLLNQDTVLTVAHCLEGVSNSDVKVLLGDFDADIDEPEEVLVAVRSIDRHTNFRVHKEGDRIEGNDIAVLKLEQWVNFTTRIAPICLPDPAIPIIGWDMVNDRIKPEEGKSQCYIAGWGATKKNGPTGGKLRTARVTLMNRGLCNTVLSSQQSDFGGLPGDIMCTDTSQTNSDGCKYDDGDMLACLNTNGQYTLLGLMSRYSCGNLPTLYTRILSHITDIKNRL